MYLAVDHLHTDVVGQHISCFELACLFAKHASDQAPPIPRPASYTEYFARERDSLARLTPASPEVETWLRPLRGNDGELPSFPLDLGLRGGDSDRSAHRTVPLFGEGEAARFEKVCRDHGGEFAGSVFAAAALAERELTDGDYYFGITPLNTRTTFEELASIGWYVALVPVAFPIGVHATFERTVARAQRAYENGMRLEAATIHRVLEPAPHRARWALREPGGRRGGADLDQQAAHRNHVSVIYPDNTIAHESVDRYLTTLSGIFRGAVRED